MLIRVERKPGQDFFLTGNQTGKKLHRLSERVTPLGIMGAKLRGPFQFLATILLWLYSRGFRDSIGPLWYREMPFYWMECTLDRCRNSRLLRSKRIRFTQMWANKENKNKEKKNKENKNEPHKMGTGKWPSQNADYIADKSAKFDAFDVFFC